MRALGIVAILAVGLAGCGGDSGIVGTWKLDIDHLKAGASKAMDEQIAKVPEAARAAVEKMRDSQMKAMDAGKMTLVIKGDGTYSADNVNPMTQEAGTAKGTWKEADGGYLLEQTHEDGKEKKNDAFKVRMEDGFLYGKPDADMPFEIRLKR